MKHYTLIGKIKSHRAELNRITLEFTELASKMIKIKPRSYYERALADMSPNVYQRKTFQKPSEQEINEQVLSDLEQIANHKMFSLTKDTHDGIEKFVHENASNALKLRHDAYTEIENFYNQLEDDAENEANYQFQKDYEKQYEAKKNYVNGDDEIVRDAFDLKFDIDLSEINLPFDLVISIDYNQENKIAWVELLIPQNLGLPTQKINVSANFGRVSVKDKLIREIDTETSKTIVGLAYYIASYVFDVSPNIEFVDLSILADNKSVGYLWVEYVRSKFARMTNVEPLTGIFDWEHICNIKIVRGGTRIDPIDIETLRNQVNLLKRGNVGLME